MKRLSDNPKGLTPECSVLCFCSMLKESHLLHGFLPVSNLELSTDRHGTRQLLDFSKTMPSLVSTAWALQSFSTIYRVFHGP